MTASDEGRPAPDIVLPRLGGRGFKAYVAVWFTLLTLAVVAVVGGAWAEVTARPTWNPYGFYTLNDGRALTAVSVFSDAAKASGLRPQDEIVAIDGRSVDDIGRGTFALFGAMDRPDGQTVRLGVVGEDGRAREVVLRKTGENLAEKTRTTGMSDTTGRLVPVLSGLLSAGGLIAAAVLLFRRRHEAVPALLSAALLAMAASSGLAGALWAGLGWYLAGSLMAAFGWSAFVLSMFAFPSGRLGTGWRVVMAATATLTIGLVSVLPVSELVVALGYVLPVAASVLAVILRYRRLPPGAERQQMRWALLGFALGMVALAVLAGVGLGLTPRYLETGWGPWLKALEGLLFAGATFSFAGGLLISLLRYRLYDADVAIMRSVTYGAVTLMLVVVFAAGEKIIEVLGDQLFGAELGVWAGGIGAALAAAMVAPTHHWISAWAEGRFRRPLVVLRRDLPELVDDLRETDSSRGVAQAVVEEAVRGVTAQRAALVMGEIVLAERHCEVDGAAEAERARALAHDRTVHVDRADPSFPVRVRLTVNSQDIGLLLLGPRPDGSLYGRDEREALAEIAAPVARALFTTHRREQAAEALERRLAALDRALAAMEGRR